MKQKKAVSTIVEELGYFVQYPLGPETTKEDATYYAQEEIARCKRRAALLEALLSEALYTEQPDYPAKKMDGSPE